MLKQISSKIRADSERLLDVIPPPEIELERVQSEEDLLQVTGGKLSKQVC